MISRNYFTFPLYVPRICRQWSNWPQFLVNYVLRRKTPAEYRMRNGVRLLDCDGTLAGTLAVVFVRQEYGSFEDFRTIVDVGANMGSFAVYAAQSCPECRIYCFEPETRNFDFLVQNIRRNDLENRVCAVQCAVASSAGHRELAIANSLENSFHMRSAGAIARTVSCTTLHNILEAHALSTVDLLKLNCEGAEYEILESCSAADFARIAKIRLEYHNLDPRRTGDALTQLLQDNGYQIERFTRYGNTSGFIWAMRAQQLVYAFVPGLFLI